MAKTVPVEPVELSPKEQRLRSEIEGRLLPMLCAANLGKQRTINTDGRLVSLDTKGRIVVRASADTDSAFRLYRDYPFNKSELKLARRFVEECLTVCDHHDMEYVDDLAVAVPRKAIGRAIGYENPALVARILDQFDELSSQTYERQRISAAIGLTNIERDSGVSLPDIWGEDFAKMLTSGIESMLVVDPKGRVYAHLVPNADADHIYSPHHLRFLSEWTTDSQICLVLNRNGEILILKNKKLEFARRRGRWLHFAHDSVIPLIRNHAKSVSLDLANKIHQTCLDVSFARSGGCIAVVRKAKKRLFDKAQLVSPDDFLGTSDSAKAKSLHWLTTKGKVDSSANFCDLDRRFRQELVAIDGATVIDCDGTLLAAGAIVKVKPGSASGARRAAARALAEFGIGIKTSADGEVSGFLADGTSSDAVVSEKRIFRYG